MSLSKEREGATFSSDVLRNYLHGGAYELQAAAEKLFEDPLFDRSKDCFMSREEYVQVTTKRSMETYRIIKRSRQVLSKHSPLHGDGGFYVGGLGTPTGLSDHFALFVGTLLFQATEEQQREWLMKSVNLQIIGTYAQTELAHGSNVRALGTTATYDSATDEFIIHMADRLSSKWWPGALGLLATHAIVYARLIINGKDEGFNAFMVQIRDEHHRPLKGVEVGDIGPKMGYNAYDSGYLFLQNVRIPRFNMLARFQQVNREGKYSPAPKALQKIAYLTMLKTRVFIVKHCGPAISAACTVAIRYNATRRQGFIDSKKGGEEAPILDYQNQQDHLFGALSAAMVLWVSSSSLQSHLDSFAAALSKADAKSTGADVTTLPLLHATSAGLKAHCTQLATDLVEDVRKCCGGHAFSHHAGLAMGQLTFLPSVTYEGDIIPMALQTARFLVGCLRMLQMKKAIAPEMAFLAEDDAPLPSKEVDLLRLGSWVNVYTNACRNAVGRAAMMLVEQVQEHSKTQDQAWNAAHTLLFRASRAFTLLYVLREFAVAIKKIDDSAVREVMEDLGVLFGISRLTDLHPVDHRLPAETVILAETAKNSVLAKIRPNAVAICDSFGWSDFKLNSTIGSYDNSDMYEKMVKHVRANPVNSERYVQSFHQEVLTEFLNKEKLIEMKRGQSKI